MRHKIALTSLSGIIALGLVQPCSAQGRNIDAAQSDIVVTAQKRETRLQDTPLSVTAVGRAELEERGATDVKDILGSIPGLAFNQNDPSQTRYNIRGLATTSASPTVGIYLDDISLLTQANDFSGAFDIVFFDIERLEVLKGPQGTLYGGSTMGGAIKYVSSRPDLNRQSMEVAAGVGTIAHGSESYNVEAIANIPIVEGKFAIRAGGYYQHIGGYIDNVGSLPVANPSVSTTAAPNLTPQSLPSLSELNRKDINFIDIYGARLSALWEPGDDWSIRPQIVYQQTNLNTEPDLFTNQGGLTASYRLRSPKRDEGTIYSLQIDKQIGSAVDVTSLTSYFDRDLRFSRDYSFEIARLTGGATSAFYGNDSISLNPDHVKTFSQELRIGSAPAASKVVTWLVGLYYSDQDERMGQTVITDSPIFPNNISYVSDSKRELTQYAAFGEATLHITDRLDLTAGARAFKIKQSTDEYTDGILAGGLSRRAGKANEDGINPKFGIAYKATPDNLLYANAAKGFRPGGLNFGALPNTAVCRADLTEIGRTDRPAQFESDRVWTYEAGSKNSFGGGAVTVNAAGFYSKWSDIQQRVFLPNCGFGFTDNFGSAEIKGGEFEASVRPIDGLHLGGNLTYTDTEITKAAFGTTARNGDEIQFVPKWMASVYGSYSIPVGGEWGLTLRGDYQYRSRQRYAYERTRSVRLPNGTSILVPNEAEFQEGSQVVNVNATLADGKTSLRFYINNLTDTRPLSRVVRAFPERAQTLRPRSIGMEVRQSF
ncbi:TonB-dependent receptor [Sphingobium sp.]|uniref:TonB-dependent receptor n=1 Tax=Sphingobium sp. TaxID=1912891 RepID=UPI003B3A70F6